MAINWGARVRNAIRAICSRRVVCCATAMRAGRPRFTNTPPTGGHGWNWCACRPQDKIIRQVRRAGAAVAPGSPCAQVGRISQLQFGSGLPRSWFARGRQPGIGRYECGDLRIDRPEIRPLRSEHRMQSRRDQPVAGNENRDPDRQTIMEGSFDSSHAFDNPSTPIHVLIAAARFLRIA